MKSLRKRIDVDVKMKYFLSASDLPALTKYTNFDSFPKWSNVTSLKLLSWGGCLTLSGDGFFGVGGPVLCQDTVVSLVLT